MRTGEQLLVPLHQCRQRLILGVGLRLGLGGPGVAGHQRGERRSGRHTSELSSVHAGDSRIESVRSPALCSDRHPDAADGWSCAVIGGKPGDSNEGNRQKVGGGRYTAFAKHLLAVPVPTGVKAAGPPW